MERIAILAALPWECRPAVQALSRVQRGKVGPFAAWNGVAGDTTVCVVRTGMGLERAEAAARALAAGEPLSLMLSTGCAGALAEHLAPGDLVVADSVGLAGATPTPIAAELISQARAAAARAGLAPTIGPFLSSPVVLKTSEKKRGAGGAVAVEMEGAAIARVAAEHGVPFAAVRSILDAADTDLDFGGAFVDPATGALRPLALAGHLIRHPSSAAGLMRMKQMADASERALARFFAAYLTSGVRRDAPL